VSHFDDRPSGFYWIRYLEPVIENGGVADERWTEPLVAELRDGHWLLTGMEGELVFDVEVLRPLFYSECSSATAQCIWPSPPRVFRLPPLASPTVEEFRAGTSYRVVHVSTLGPTKVGHRVSLQLGIGFLRGVVTEVREDGYVLGEPEWC
jgi:hypothetical protein